MSEFVLFIIGFVVFLVVTSCVMVFGYFHFNLLYRRDSVSAAVTSPDATDRFFDLVDSLSPRQPVASSAD